YLKKEGKIMSTVFNKVMKNNVKDIIELSVYNEEFRFSDIIFENKLTNIENMKMLKNYFIINFENEIVYIFHNDVFDYDDDVYASVLSLGDVISYAKGDIEFNEIDVIDTEYIDKRSLDLMLEDEGIIFQHTNKNPEKLGNDIILRQMVVDYIKFLLEESKNKIRQDKLEKVRKEKLEKNWKAVEDRL